MTQDEPAAPERGDNPVPALDVPNAESIGLEGPEGVLGETSASVENPPPPSASKAVLLEWAYDEYHRRQNEGEQLDPQSYCERFPSCRSALQRMLGMDLFAVANPTFLTSKRKAICWPVGGEQRGDLTILRPLGRGAFSRVFLAAEASTGGRLVAVKFSEWGDAEARTLGRLSHPHIVPILWARLEESSGLSMVCMPYLGSATLEDVLDRSAPTPEAPRPRTAAVLLDVLRASAQPEDPPAAVDPRLRIGSYVDGIIHLAIPMAEALAFLHQRRVCHRDLKPSNVLLDPSGKPLLLDFNLSTSDLEASVPVGGTIRYMAPEQLHAFGNKGADGVDERADLFAFGAIVYELLAGDHPCGPFPTDLIEQPLAPLLLERMKRGVRPLRRLCPDLERPVAAALESCLAVDPADRPRSAVELAAELRRQFAPARRMRRWLAERPRTVVATIGLLLVAASVAGYAWSVAPPYSQREYQRGETAYRSGDYDEAERHFDRAVQAEPSNPRLRFARGCARLKQSESQPGNNAKLDQAWEDLKPAHEGAMDAPLLIVRAYIESRKRNVRLAIELYNQLPAGYRPVVVRNNRAYCSILQKNFLEAGSDLDAAARLDPSCQAVFYNRARLALYKQGEVSMLPILPQALEDMERALRLGPATPSLYRDAARLYDWAAWDSLRRIPLVFRAPMMTAFHVWVAQQRIAYALSYLRQAIANGESLDSITKDYRFQIAESHPDFAQLRRLKPQRTIPPLELRLIDPINLPD